LANEVIVSPRDRSPKSTAAERGIVPTTAVVPSKIDFPKELCWRYIDAFIALRFVILTDFSIHVVIRPSHPPEAAGW
jgi:hypothetical protein